VNSRGASTQESSSTGENSDVVHRKDAPRPAASVETVTAVSNAIITTAVTRGAGGPLFLCCTLRTLLCFAYKITYFAFRSVVLATSGHAVLPSAPNKTHLLASIFCVPPPQVLSLHWFVGNRYSFLDGKITGHLYVTK
jgi:hypothetical protein